MAADGVVQPGVVALADQRDDHVVLAADLGQLLDHPLDGGVGDLADAMVLVSRMGVSSRPHSWTCVIPETSPAPLRTKPPATTRLSNTLALGMMAVTPVRTGPLPRSSGPSPMISVVCPTCTPATSVMAFDSPTGNRPMEKPSSRRRCLIPTPASTEVRRRPRDRAFSLLQLPLRSALPVPRGAGGGCRAGAVGAAAAVAGGDGGRGPRPWPRPLASDLASGLTSLRASVFASRRFSRRRLRPPSRISPISVRYSIPAAEAIRQRSE